MFYLSSKWFEEETKFIESVLPHQPGKSFNHSSACFVRYCNMQSNKARKNGFGEISERILNCRDIAALHVSVITGE